MYLNLLSDDFQIYGFLYDGIIIRILLSGKGKLQIKENSIYGRLLESYWGRSYHFGRKLLEQLADQATSGLSVSHHRIKELLKDFFQTGRGALVFTSNKGKA